MTAAVVDRATATRTRAAAMGLAGFTAAAVAKAEDAERDAKKPVATGRTASTLKLFSAMGAKANFLAKAPPIEVTAPAPQVDKPTRQPAFCPVAHAPAARPRESGGAPPPIKGRALVLPPEPGNALILTVPAGGEAAFGKLESALGCAIAPIIGGVSAWASRTTASGSENRAFAISVADQRRIGGAANAVTCFGIGFALAPICPRDFKVHGAKEMPPLSAETVAAFERIGSR